MANSFGFMMKEEFLQAYADYVKQLREQNPGKRYGVMLSLDLIPDGVGYEISSPQLTVNEVTEDGKQSVVMATSPSGITIDEVKEIGTADTERDTHFAGFARLLWEEMLSQTQWQGIDVTAGHIPLHHPEDEEHKRYIDLIAQRAYDLAYHVLDNIWEVHNPEALLERTSDLTEWPVKPDEN